MRKEIVGNFEKNVTDDAQHRLKLNNHIISSEIEGNAKRIDVSDCFSISIESI